MNIHNQASVSRGDKRPQSQGTKKSTGVNQEHHSQKISRKLKLGVGWFGSKKKGRAQSVGTARPSRGRGLFGRHKDKKPKSAPAVSPHQTPATTSNLDGKKQEQQKVQRKPKVVLDKREYKTMKKQLNEPGDNRTQKSDRRKERRHHLPKPSTNDKTHKSHRHSKHSHRHRNEPSITDRTNKSQHRNESSTTKDKTSTSHRRKDGVDHGREPSTKDKTHKSGRDTKHTTKRHHESSNKRRKRTSNRAPKSMSVRILFKSSNEPTKTRLDSAVVGESDRRAGVVPPEVQRDRYARAIERIARIQRKEQERKRRAEEQTTESEQPKPRTPAVSD